MSRSAVTPARRSAPQVKTWRASGSKTGMAKISRRSLARACTMAASLSRSAPPGSARWTVSGPPEKPPTPPRPTGPTSRDRPDMGPRGRQTE
eukprot:286948-Pyramimonas_sp.AAC.1